MLVWNTCRVLLVDPRRAFPEPLLAALESHGQIEFASEPGATGAVDVQLLVLQPLELAVRAIREARDALPHVPVIVYDPYPSISRQTTTFDLGAHGYTIEGVTLEELMTVITMARLGGFATCRNAVALLRQSLSAPATFSERQQLIMTMVAKGGTNEEIARELGCSPRTVEDEVRQMCREMGVRSRTSLTTWWVRTMVEAGVSPDSRRAFAVLGAL